VKAGRVWLFDGAGVYVDDVPRVLPAVALRCFVCVLFVAEYPDFDGEGDSGLKNRNHVNALHRRIGSFVTNLSNRFTIVSTRMPISSGVASPLIIDAVMVRTSAMLFAHTVFDL